ncbi:eCIS core domain-containing protein [Phormidesmis sp. 146-33]
MFDRPFPKRSAATEESSTDTPDFQARLEFAHTHAPDLKSLAANSSRDRTPSIIQPKLTVGAPNDPYEQEADRMADQVMSMPDSAVQQPIHREAILEDKELQTKPALRRSTDDALQTGNSVENQLNSSKGGGSTMPDDLKSYMESRFNTDFSRVRIHTDSNSVDMNEALEAQAFTYGNDVFFGESKYDTVSTEGKKLLAHELTHVVQQTGNEQPIEKKQRNTGKATYEAVSDQTNALSRSAAKPLVQLTPKIYTPANNSYSQPEINPDPVVAYCRQAAGNTTGLISDEPLWNHCQDLEGQIMSQMTGSYFQSNSTGYYSKVYDPGLMYLNYKVTVNITMYEDPQGATTPGSVATVGSKAISGSRNQNSESQQQTTTFGGSGEASKENSGKLGANLGSSVTSTTGHDSGITTGSETSSSQNSKTVRVNSKLLTKVKVSVQQYDRIAEYHSWSSTSGLLAVGNVTYTRPTQEAAPPPEK